MNEIHIVFKSTKLVQTLIQLFCEKKLKIEDTYKMEDKYLKWSNIWKKLYFINTRCMHWI